MTLEEYKMYLDEPVNRRGTGSLKWDVGAEELPMWVADMDFRTSPEIIRALEKRVSHGVFGYSVVPDEWYEAYGNWWERRHHFRFEKEWLIFSTGVVPILSSVVRKLTTPGENVLIQTPVYNIFFNSIVNNGRNVLESPLVYKDGEYHMDFDQIEKDLSNPQTTMMILCNPQNPAGKIWDRDTLIKVGELCHKHNVIVVSDEIHCDITDPGKEYIPFASVSEICKNNSITCVAPTKAFNLAGLQTAAAVVPNSYLRHKVNRALNTDEVAEPNAFAIEAAVAAFTKGEPWLTAVCEYIYENKRIVKKYLEENMKELRLVSSDATYLLWIDIQNSHTDSVRFVEKIREKTGLYLSDGAQYGKTSKAFLRMNIACPRETLLDGLERLKKGIQ